MYDYSETKKNIPGIMKWIDQDKLDFSIAFQREEVWDKLRMSELIHSILEGMPIGVIWCERDTESGTMYVLDGKQRLLSSIYRFVSDGGFKLHSKTPPVEDEHGNLIEIARHGFSDLSDEFKKRIMEYSITIWRFDNLTDQQRRRIFTMINNGKPLSVIELLGASMKSLGVFQSIAKHPALVTAVSATGKKNREDVRLANYIWIMFNQEKPGFYKKNLEETNNIEVTQEQQDEIIRALDYVSELYLDVNESGNKEQLASMKKKTHIVSLADMARMAIRDGIDVNEYIEKAKAFFICSDGMTTVSEAYNTAAREKGSNPEQVAIRKEEIEKALSA